MVYFINDKPYILWNNLTIVKMYVVYSLSGSFVLSLACQGAIYARR
jgi:hypothetical protein